MSYRDPTQELLSIVSSLTQDEQRALINNPGRLRVLATELLGRSSLMKIGHLSEEIRPWPVTLDYRLTIGKIFETGNYDWTDDEDLVEPWLDFPGTGFEIKVFYLIHPKRYATSREIRRYLHSFGLQAAGVRDVLGYGATYPDIQRIFPIVALDANRVGKVGTQPRSCVICLDARQGKRGVALARSDMDDTTIWSDQYYFLAFCKSSPAWYRRLWQFLVVREGL